MSSGLPLLAIVALPFIGSLVAIFLRQDARNGAAFLAGSVALCATVLTALQYRAVGHGGVLRVGIEWLPSLGLDFALRMDGFAWLFAMLVTGIGLLVVLYARYYMSPDDPVPRFFAFLLAFMGAMLGVVLSGNLIQLVFFWELTSLFSFLLIGYWHHNASRARRRAHGADRHRPPAGCACSPACCCSATSSAATTSTACWPSGDRIRAHRALPAGAGPGPARRPDQERAVPVPLLAAARHGGADAGLGLPALGDDGEGRRVPAGAALAGAGRHRGLVLDRRRRPAWRRCCSAPTSRSSSTT